MAAIRGHAFWLDRNGEPQVYFSGSHYGSVVCGCFEIGSCRASPLNATCNCDVTPVVHRWLTDSGAITNASALPITGFLYGFLPEGGHNRAKITVGRLKCWGEAPSGPPGSSCRALQDQGLVTSGYQVIKENENAEPKVAFCDLTNLASQRDVGTIDIKEQQVKNALIKCRKTSGSISANQKISFNDISGENVGDSSEILIIPKTATYRISVSGLCLARSAKWQLKSNIGDVLDEVLDEHEKVDVQCEQTTASISRYIHSDYTLSYLSKCSLNRGTQKRNCNRLITLDLTEGQHVWLESKVESPFQISHQSPLVWILEQL